MAIDINRPHEGERKTRHELEADLDWHRATHRELEASLEHADGRIEALLQDNMRLREANRGYRRGLDRLQRRVSRLTNGNQIGED